MGETEGQIPEWIPNEVITDPGNKCQLTHMFETFSALHKLQKEGSLCDITIKVDDTSFQAHKVVLASCTEYFKAMFSSGFQESQQSEVNINGKSETFQILLDFAYSGQFKLSMETVIDVLKMAHYLQFDKVMEGCASFLTAELGNQRVDVRSSIKILSIADLYGLDNLKKASKENIAKNFKTSDDFLQHMTPKLMEEIMQRSDLTDEKEVFDTSLAWLQHDWENRQVHAPTLLRIVRLGLVPIGHLSMTRIKSPHLYAIPECKELIDNALKLSVTKKPSDPPLHYTHPDLFATRTTVSAFLAFIPHRGLGRGYAKYWYYSTNTIRWIQLTKFPDMPKNERNTFRWDNFIIAQGKLFVARCPDEPACTWDGPQFLCLNAADSRWHTLAPMAKNRIRHPLVQMDGDIYAIGGTALNICCCEVYNINENKWHAITRMRVACAVEPSSAAAYIGKIFHYGADISEVNGHVEHYLQMYNPVLDSWFHIATFCHPLCLFEPNMATGLLVHEGKCYRIVDARCSCTVEGCQWHELCVDELLIDVINKTAVVGERQNQAVIPAQFREEAFRINQDVFVICGRKYHKTGIKIASNQVNAVNLDAWSNLKLMDKYDTVFFTFDTAPWL